MSIQTYIRQRFIEGGSYGGPNIYHFDPTQCDSVDTTRSFSHWFAPGDLVRHANEEITGFGMVIASERPKSEGSAVDGYVIVMWSVEPDYLWRTL